MANPILNENFVREEERILQGEPMTINGTLQVTAILAVVLTAAAAFVWSRFSLGYTDMAMMLTFGGFIGGLILGIGIPVATRFVHFDKIKIFVPIYALCEGLLLGGISASMEATYNGIVTQAVAGTFATLFVMLILYRGGIIKCTEKFRAVVLTSTLSIAGVYFIDLIGRSFFHLHVPIINDASPAGIAVSLFIIAIAALNLIIDFDFIEKASRSYMPKSYEWYGAFGLMVTLVWLYLEILRLLAKMNRK